MAVTDGFAGSGADFRTRLQNWLPKIVLAPSFAIMVIFVYGFIAFTIYLSFTDSRMLPSYGWVGFENYVRFVTSSAFWPSITVTFDPRRICACAISMPMGPPPTIRRCSGLSRSSDAASGTDCGLMCA